MVLPPSTPPRSNSESTVASGPTPQIELDHQRQVAPETVPQRNRWRVPAIALLGLTLFGTLGVLTSLIKIDSIEDRLQAAAIERLEEAGIIGATVEMDGRDATVVGLSVADSARAQAVLDDEWGIRQVAIDSSGDDVEAPTPNTTEPPASATTNAPAPSTTSPPPETTAPTPETTVAPTITSTSLPPEQPAIVDLILTVQDGELILDGEVLDNGQRDTLRAAAIETFGEEQFDDRIRVLDATPEIPGSDDRVNELAQIVKVLSPATSASATVLADELSIEVVAASENDAQDVDEAIFKALSFESIDASVEVGPGQDGQLTLPELVAEFNSLDSFTTGTSDITEDGTAVLTQIAGLLGNTTDAIQIQGHTDSEGELLDNLRLSQGRADSVAAVLIEEGIDRSRIISLGFGENEPIASNDSDEGRAENSRIEFVITP